MNVQAADPQSSVAQDSQPRAPMPPLPRGWTSLPRAFVLAARERGGTLAVCDSTGAKLSYRDTLIRALALARALSRRLDSSQYVGVLLPPSAPCIVANIAIAILGKVAVNLNYTASQESIDSAVQQTGLTKVITANRMLEKVPIRPKAELIALEEFATTVTKADKAWAFFLGRVVPVGLLGRFLPSLSTNSLDAPATVIFTSGSTGEPKGVVLTHGNVLSNVVQIREHVALKHEEVVLGILPLFHSFGYTVTLWTVLCLGFRGVYHNNPLDGRIVGKLCKEHQATILFASPTFVRGYLKKCDREQFATIRLLVLGAEKLKPELAEQIRRDLGIEPLEGYGCTETGPVVSVNVPQPMVSASGQQVPGNRPGTVGLMLPGTAAKTLDPESGDVLPAGSEGVIAVKGPQIMAGYLNRPDATAKVLQDGWYNTGDLGYVDPDGFLKITDRLSRFSKVGGEMVPHLAVENALQDATGVEDPCLAVTALPDPKRGERLVVLYTGSAGLRPEDLRARVSAGALPKLWIPGPDDFVEVDELPVLGTGKLDLRRLRQIAEERFGAP